MIPVWLRAGFSLGWLLVVAELLWWTIGLSHVLVTLVTVLIVAVILMLSAHRLFTRDAWQAVATQWGLLLLPALPLAGVFSRYYHVAVVSGAALLLWWIVPRLLVARRPWHTVGWGGLVVLVLLLMAVYRSVRLNFMLTAAARQRVVDRIIQNQTARSDGAVITQSGLERLLLGRATAYRDDQTIAVYFDLYRSPLEAAFVVYTPAPDRGGLLGNEIISLAHDWVFLRRGYAN